MKFFHNFSNRDEKCQKFSKIVGGDGDFASVVMSAQRRGGKRIAQKKGAQKAPRSIWFHGRKGPPDLDVRF